MRSCPPHLLLVAALAHTAACAQGSTAEASTSFTASASAGQTTGTGSDTGTVGGTGTGSGSSGSGSSGTSTGAVTGSTGPDSTGPASTGPASTSGTTGGLVCDPSYEPNDSEEQAAALGIIDDCDGSGSAFTSELEGDGDVDWFTYSASDVFGCVVDPTRDVITPAPVRFCKFINCASGQASIDGCPSGASAATSPSGHPGCCKYGTNLSNFDVAIDCPGSDDSAQVLMRIDSGPAGVCTAYTINYHF